MKMRLRTGVLYAGISLLAATQLIARGALTNVTLTPSNTQAGVGTIYTVSFTTDAAGNGLPADGKLVFLFPAGFDVSGVEIAANTAGLDGGYASIVSAGQTLTLTRDGTGAVLPAGASATLKIATANNPETAGGAYTIRLTTQDGAGTVLDGPTISSAFSITPGPLDHFRFAALADQTAGQAFSVTVFSEDEFDNAVTHSGTVTLTDDSSTLTASPLIFVSQTNQTISDAAITLAQTNSFLTATGDGKTGDSNLFTVTPDTLHHIEIFTELGGVGEALLDTTLTADEILVLSSAGFDSFNNYIADVPVNWEVIGGIGSLSATTGDSITTFFADTVGVGQITFQHAALSPDTTGFITVTPGAPLQVKILRGASGDSAVYVPLTYATGQTDTVHAASFDGDGNYIADEIVDWRISGGIGSLNPANGVMTVFSATTPGTGQITADHFSLFDEVTGAITVGAGGLAYIKIVEGPFGDGPELDAKNLSADETVTLHAAGYDANDNYLGDQIAFWSSTGGLSPVVTDTAVAINYNPKTAPVTGSFLAFHPTATGDATGTISIGVGAAHHVKILSGAAGNTGEVGAAGLTTGETLTLHAASFDADDNYIDDVAVNWLLSGGVGSLSSASGIATILTATSAGTGQISTQHGSLLDDATGTITVNPGALAYVRIVEGPAGDGAEFTTKSMTTDETLTLHAAGYDASDNYLGDQTVIWTSTGALAPILNESGVSVTFQPTQAPATGTILATHGTATGDETGTISVGVGAPHHLKILEGGGGQTPEVTTSGLTAGGKLIVHAASFDAADNYIGDASASWTVSGGIGTLNPTTGVSTELTAIMPGSGQISASDGLLLGDATGVITVSVGTVAEIRIVEGMSGDGLELGNVAMTADDVLFVHAAGYDAFGNYVGDQNVTWSGTNDLAGIITGTSTKITFSPTTAPAVGAISADHPTATDDVTGTITVGVGAEHHVKVLTGASGDTPEVTTVGLTTGGTLEVHAASFDADDNYVTDISVGWSLSGDIGSLDTGVGVTTTLTAAAVGTGQISADHPSLFDDATGVITVNAGTLAYVRIVEGPSGDGAAFGARTLTTDESITLHAAGYDASDNYLGDQSVIWTGTDGLAGIISGSGTSITFNPNLAPNSGTIVADHATATDDATGLITINVGAEHHVKILSDASGETSEIGSAGLVTGNTLTVHAASFDADNNYVQDVSVNWALSGGIGTLSETSSISTILTATTAGTGQITADHATLLDDATGTITVTAGALDYIKIVAGLSGDGAEFDAATLTTDQSLTLHAAGYDASDNYLGDQSVTWTGTGGLAGIISGGGTSVIFNPSLAPNSGTIVADHATATDDTTGLITINVGAEHHVKVLDGASGETSEVTTVGLTTGGTLEVHAASFDADNNYVQDVSVDWTLSGGIGTLSQASGISTILTATTAGSGQITADHATLLDDATGAITVSAGTLAYVKIVAGPSGDGAEFDAATLTTDESLTLHAAGYDASDNYLGDQTVDWSGTDGLNGLISANGTSITFNPSLAPNSGTIIADHAAATDDATGLITINVGAEHHVKVLSGASGETTEVGASGLVTGNTLTVHAASFDADNNYVQDVSVNWTLSGGIGTLSDASAISTILTATTAGTGQITADHPTLLDDATGTITVTAGTLAYIKIVAGPSGDGAEFDAATLTTDESLTLHAAGYDASDNYLGDQTVDWSGTDGLNGLISESGTSMTFNPNLAPISGTIIADHASASDDVTGLITINVGAPHHVKALTGAAGNTPEALTAGLVTGNTLTVHAASFDADDNYIDDVTVDWFLSGGIGVLSAANGVSTTLTATTAGSGQITADHATLLDDATGAITVTAGTLAYIKIVAGPSGDGAEFTSTTLTTDDALTLHAAGYDASDNYLGDQTVDWSGTDGLAGLISATGTTITFNPNLAPISGTIFADHSSATDDATGLITINVGAEHHVKVLDGVVGETSEVTAVGLTTGGTLEVHAASFDADNNYVQDVSVNWSLSGGIGTLSQASGASTILTATTAGSGQITADHATLLDDATGAITVSAGTLAYVKIVAGPSGDGAEFDTANLTTDQSLTLHAAGYDASDNYLGDQTVDWSGTDGLAGLISATGTTITFNPNLAPISGTIVADHATATDDATGLITINVGAPHHVKALSGLTGETSEVETAGLVTGGTLTLHAASFDADDNYIADVSVDWRLSGNIGTLSQASGVSTILTATTAGTGQITADHAILLDDATGTITVTTGALDYIKIVAGPSGDGAEFDAVTLTTDQSLTLHAAGYDANDNYLGDQTVDWGGTDGLNGLISETGTTLVFNPNLAPVSGTITADHASATDDATNLITINVGAEHHVKVLSESSGETTEVGAAGLVTGNTLTVHAASFDADDNYVQDVSVDWGLSGGIGTLSQASGISTILTATTGGTGQITADHAALLDDATGTITVTTGTLAYVKIVEGPFGDGPEFGARTLTTDESIALHAAGYDANDNYLGDQTVTWAGTDGLAGQISATGPMITFAPAIAPSSGTISVTHASASGDATGQITINTGAAHHVKALSGESGNTSEMASAGLVTGNTLSLHAASFDADDNYIEDVVVDWTLSGGIGVLSQSSGVSTVLTATTVGAGQITADHASLLDDATGIITVNAGTLAYVKIVEGPSGDGAELDAKNLTADQTLTLHAAGYDASDNYLGDQTVTWGATGSLAPAPSFSGTTFTFSPTTAPANGTITAIHASVPGDETGTISVGVGAEHHVLVLQGGNGETAEVSATALSTGATLTVHAASFDADQNYVQDVSVNWILSNNIGALSTASGVSTILTTTTPGSAVLTADHASLLDDASGTITVNTGNVASIKIRTAPNNGGDEVDVLSLTTDDETTFYAAGYDGSDNYFGDVSVTWTNSGTLEPTVNANGSSFTFSPTKGLGDGSISGTIIATYPGNISDATGTIAVFPGAPVGQITLTANPSGLPSDGASLSQITSDVILDAENNPVGAGKLFSVTITPANLGQIATPDADPGTAGHQIATLANGTLDFSFQAGTSGGVATVNVSGGLAAGGNTQISLGSLSILSISAASEKVSQGQTGVLVNMTVQNLAASPITQLAGALTFTGSIDRTSEFTVTPKANNPTAIAGGGTETLGFFIDVSPSAALENITIDGSASGKINTTDVATSGAATPDAWAVQRPAQVDIHSVITSADTVVQGQQGLQVRARVENNFGLSDVADAIVDSVRLVFRQGPVERTAEYVVAPSSANPTMVPGGGAVDFNFTVNVGLSATTGLTVLDAEIYARDANSDLTKTDLNAATPDGWEVIPGDAFQIAAITPSQTSVTESMLKSWQIQMTLNNSGPSAITLDLSKPKTFLRLQIGASDVTGQYTIIQPTQFDAGGTTLAANSNGVLTFTVTKTGASTGVATILGFAEGTDTATSQPISDNTNDGGTGEVNVQTQGVLSVTSVQPSEPLVTANRDFDWRVTAQVTNTGGSALELTESPSVILIGSNAGFAYVQPRFFTNGDSVLAANESRQFEMIVDQTGTQLGDLPISLTLNAMEQNSGRAVSSNAGAGTVKNQSQAALVIQNVSISAESVTAGQTAPWTATVVVENTGQSQVDLRTDAATNLRFRLNGNFQNDYIVALAEENWLGSRTKQLAGNSVDSLRFEITQTGAGTGFPELWVTAATTETNSGAEVSANDNGSATVEVQAGPNLSYIAGSLAPAIVNNGSFYAFEVRINNGGQALVALNPEATTLTFSDGGNAFSAALDANRATDLPAGETVLTFRSTQIPQNMAAQNYAPQITLNGMQNGNNFSQTLTTETNALNVSAPASVQIIALRPSQPTVTRQMTKDWFLTLIVRNNGGAEVALDSLDLVLLNGGNVTPEYTLSLPAAFLGSGSTLLGGGQTDSLRFDILDTGIKTGATTAQAKLWVIDQSNQQTIFAQTEGGGGFQVQSPATLEIVDISTSQARATQNQAQAWNVDVLVRNNGESSLDLNFDADSSGVNFSLDSGDYQISQPASLMSGDTILTGQSSGTLRYAVLQTGAQTGENLIQGFVRGVERNSDAPYFSQNDPENGGQVKIETPARLRIKSVEVSGAPNLPFVNVNQTFNVDVLVENLGEAATDSVQIQLLTDASSTIATPLIVLPDGVEGGSIETASFAVTASAGTNPLEQFFANLTGAKARNTGLNAVIEPPLDNETEVTIQLPATLEILEVLTSVDSVNAAQSAPWRVSAVVQNAGGATFRADSLLSNNLQFRIGEEVQADYVVSLPQAFANGADLNLPGGVTDTLIFTVNTTGQRGGDVDIFASLSGKDLNAAQPLNDQNSGAVFVRTTARVRVLKTEPIVNNTLGATEVGLVNTEQVFQVRVEVENGGLEEVINVKVGLDADGNSSISGGETTINSIPGGETREALFTVTANDLPTGEASAETFTAAITEATAANSQKPATISAPADSIAQVRIQTPAELALEIEVNDDDGVLSTNQLFDITANVRNLGQSAVDSIGKLTIELPENFVLINPGPAVFEQDFIPENNVVWTVRAPETAVDTAKILVRINHFPNDKNANATAQIETDSGSVSLQIVPFDLDVTEISVSEPAGGSDNVLSTGQQFTITTRIAFSSDLEDQQRSVILDAPPGYEFRSPRQIDQFSETETWELTAPDEAHGERIFIVRAAGVTGLGEAKEDADTLRMTLVSHALLEVDAFISDPPGARDGVLSLNQDFIIRANLSNRGAAGVTGDGRIRLELGQTGITTDDPLERTISLASDGFVTWRAASPDQIAQGGITVRLIQRPLDENTNLDAAVVSEISSFTVRTDSSGALQVNDVAIASPAGAADRVLSTGQEFTLGADLTWNNIANVSARLVLPLGFFTEEERRNYTAVSGSASPRWIVRAPATPALAQQIEIILEGQDANNDSIQVSTRSLPLQVEIVEKALLRLSGEIAGPDAATDGIVSMGQEFTVSARLDNLGGAQISGEDQVRLILPEGYSMQEAMVKSAVSGPVSWLIQARETPSAGIEKIQFLLEKPPFDENSGQLAAVSNNQAEVAIQTEPKQLQVAAIPFAFGGPSAAGQSDLLMMRLRFLNIGDQGSNAVVLQGMTFFLEDRFGESIAPNSAIKELKIAKYNSGETYGALTSIPAENPLTVDLAMEKLFQAGVPDSIDILVDVSDAPSATDFQLMLASSESIQAIDAASGRAVEVIDETGATGLGFSLLSQASALSVADFKEFYNYPNPMKPGAENGTRFNFWLPQNSKVEFRILTLTGKLVYSATFDENSPQGQAGPRRSDAMRIFWDGRNGSGRTVLNGVYIAVLKTDAGVVTTKVAVAK